MVIMHRTTCSVARVDLCSNDEMVTYQLMQPIPLSQPTTDSLANHYYDGFAAWNQPITALPTSVDMGGGPTTANK